MAAVDLMAENAFDDQVRGGRPVEAAAAAAASVRLLVGAAAEGQLEWFPCSVR